MATITIPDGLHARLLVQAEAHRRSFTAEVTRLLEVAVSDEQNTALARIRSRREAMGDASSLPAAADLIRQDRDSR